MLASPASATVKKLTVPRHKPEGTSEAFHQESMKKEKKTLYMNPDDAKLSDVNGTPSNSSASQPSFVNDDGGRYMLSRGPLPSSIPGRYGSHNTAIDWTKTELRHRELKAKLQAIDHEIEKKKEDIKMRAKAPTEDLAPMVAGGRASRSEGQAQLGQACSTMSTSPSRVATAFLVISAIILSTFNREAENVLLSSFLELLAE
eukprot:gene5066-6452_t